MPDDIAPQESLLQLQRINSYTVYTLLMLGLGSMSYGYNASIIGTTLGSYLTTS